MGEVFEHGLDLAIELITLTTAIVGLVVVIQRQDSLHRTMNSRLDELVALTKKSAMAEGVLVGRADAAAEAAEAALKGEDAT